MLTSSVKRIDLAIAYLADLAVKKELKGEIYTLGLEKSDILYLGKFGAAVPAAVQKKAEDTKAAILGKKLVFENCKESGKDTRCVKKGTA